MKDGSNATSEERDGKSTSSGLFRLAVDPSSVPDSADLALKKELAQRRRRYTKAGTSTFIESTKEEDKSKGASSGARRLSKFAPEGAGTPDTKVEKTNSFSVPRTLIRRGSIYARLTSSVNPLTKIRMHRDNTLRERRKSLVSTKKKAGPASNWFYIRGLVKGAHRIFGVTRDMQNYGYPLYEYEEKEDLLREFLVSAKDRLTGETDKEEMVPWLMVHPNTMFKMVWSVILVVLLLYSAFVTPLRVAFFADQSTEDLGWLITESIVDCSFGFDILVNMCSAYYGTDGKLVTSRWRIMKEYLCGWFTIDLIACFPFQYVVAGVDAEQTVGNYNDLLRLLRIPRLYRLFKMVRILKAVTGNGKNSLSSFFEGAIKVNTSTQFS